MLFTQTIATQREGQRKMEQEKHQNWHTKEYEKNIEKERRSTHIQHNFPWTTKIWQTHIIVVWSLYCHV